MAIPYLLKGDIDEAGTYIRKDADHYGRLRIGLVHARARAVDTAARAVDLGDGRSLPYDRLLIATGSRPSRERIPGIDLPGVQTCWTLQDARAILARARPGTRVVQMGAGFVGCIIMEGLLSRGVDLTILVRSGYMVRRMMNPTASGLIRRWCEAKGVKILTADAAHGAASGRRRAAGGPGRGADPAGRPVPQRRRRRVRTWISWRAAASRLAGASSSTPTCRAACPASTRPATWPSPPTASPGSGS